MKRLFIGIPINKELILSLSSITNQQIQGVRWIAEDNWHVTVCFLGNVADNGLYSLLDSIENVISNHHPFELETDKIILAPPFGYPRMVWATFKNNKNFSKLVIEFNKLKFSKEEKTSRQIPHITLARFKKFCNYQKINLSVNDFYKKKMFVDTLILYESFLSKNGSFYKELYSWKLRLIE